MSIEHSKRHNVVILSGLSNGVENIRRAINWWRNKGLEPHVLKVGWRDGSAEFQPKLDEILGHIDNLSDQGRLSVVGTSAGGSVALNVLLHRPDLVERAVNICGRLRAGKRRWRSLERMSATSEPFRYSVLLFEQSEPQISDELRKRIMTVTARFGDELVPADTSVLEGAYNIKVPTGEHVFSIGMSLTLLAKPVIDFIQFGQPTTKE